MPIENVIYFLNHLADTSVNKNMRTIQAFVFLGIPGIFALYIVLVKMRKFRGNKVALNFLVLTIYCVSIILPATLMVRSLIFLNNIKTIPSILFLFLLFGLLYTALIQEFYPRFSYKTDIDYLKAFPLPDGSGIITTYPYPQRLQVFNILYALAFSLMFFGFAIYIFSAKGSVLQYIGISTTLITGLYWLFFLAYLCRFILCPICHRNVYGNVKANKKTYFICTIRRILMYHCFTCMYCFAHIKVGDRDIIKEKNLEIINMHQPDFTVRKKDKINVARE